MEKVEVHNIMIWNIGAPEVASLIGNKETYSQHFEIGSVTEIDVDIHGNPLEGNCIVTSPTGIRFSVNYKEGFRTKTIVVINHENIFTNNAIRHFLTKAFEERERYFKRHGK